MTRIVLFCVGVLVIVVFASDCAQAQMAEITRSVGDALPPWPNPPDPIKKLNDEFVKKFGKDFKEFNDQLSEIKKRLAQNGIKIGPGMTRPTGQLTIPKKEDKHQPDVLMYFHPNYGGWGTFLYRGEKFDNFEKIPVKNDKGEWIRFNDQLSSLKVAAGCTLILYRDADFKNEIARINGPQDVKQFNPDNQASSCRVE